MSRTILLPVLLLSALILSGCEKPAPEPGVDISALRQAVIKKTEELYLIHLKLDSAAADITKAELKARNSDCADAEYLAADAYRNLEQADQDLLQLGHDLQELFNLDVEVTNRN
ncbi:MAG: hypothetical protein HKN57_14975 [Xanthomonadales bacterium]|nr:hypothetical protein [Gammaproteobacteria bacterium]MBT8054755.1 hypothetical protein [Gammaproteobacteria bacterium]NND58548.1 hypothetical protein [Xanthomonadales bacterium]NNK52242.1 hypothetical protein [Xanthomonadales bacterium]